MKHKISAALLTVILLGTMVTCPAFATAPGLTPEEAGARLQALGIYQGNGTGDLMLDKGLTRAELAALLTRLHGEGQVDPNLYTWACYFDDVPAWAKPYVGYCTANLLVKGYGNNRYGAGDPVTPAAACTVVLRACGYADGEGTAWTYATACTYAVAQGLFSEAAARSAVISRGDMAVLICLALQGQEAVPRQQIPPQAEGITYAADGTITSKTITRSDWSREDFSLEANPDVFTGCYTREWYNAIRQSIVDRESILSGNNEDNFNPNYLYAHTLAPTHPEEAYDAFCYVLARISGAYQYTPGAEPYTQNQYEFPGYTVIKVSPGWKSPDVLDFIQPELDALAGRSDREKVIALNRYLCDLMEYNRTSTAALAQVFSPHIAPIQGRCSSYANAFSFLCGAADIPCIMIASDNHAWNEVYVDGQWLPVDVSSNDAVGGSYDTYLLSGRTIASDIFPERSLFAKELLVPGSTTK